MVFSLFIYLSKPHGIQDTLTVGKKDHMINKKRKGGIWPKKFSVGTQIKCNYKISSTITPILVYPLLI